MFWVGPWVGCLSLVVVAAGYSLGFSQLAAALLLVQAATDVPLQLSRILLSGTPGKLRRWIGHVTGVFAALTWTAAR